MQIRCRHCQNPIEVTNETLDLDIACPLCLTHINSTNDGLTQSIPENDAQEIHQFELLEILGDGAFARVYKARQIKLDRVVAVKVLHKKQFDSKLVKLFQFEAQAAARLNHRNIATVFDVFGDTDTIPFIVTAFIQGVSLKALLKKRRLDVSEAVQLTAAIADALEHAHSQNVIHRDLKPANILISIDGQDRHLRPHVIDFGLAKLETELGKANDFAKKDVPFGTYAYMPPEQTNDGRSADARSDIYSLGIVLYELLTGGVPFTGDARMLLMQIRHEPPKSPRSLNDRISRDLET